MKLTIAWIGKTKDPAIQSLTTEYLKRISRYAEVEGLPLGDEGALLKLPGKSRSVPRLILFDSRGKQFSSEEFAKFLEDRGSQALVLAIGPADGFSEAARKAAHATISLGKMTLPHELARVVLLEQVYRACTILKGHPYHTGH